MNWQLGGWSVETFHPLFEAGIVLQNKKSSDIWMVDNKITSQKESPARSRMVKQRRVGVYCVYCNESEENCKAFLEILAFGKTKG